MTIFKVPTDYIVTVECVRDGSRRGQFCVVPLPPVGVAFITDLITLGIHYSRKRIV